MSVSEVVLFFSKYSKLSSPCVNFVKQNLLQVKLVNVSNPEVRKRIMGGAYFSIKEVPTLLVCLGGQRVQLFEGYEKVMANLKKFVVPPPSPPQYELPPQYEPPPPQRQSLYGPIADKPQKIYPPDFHIKAHKKVFYAPESSSEEEEERKPRKIYKPEFGSGASSFGDSSGGPLPSMRRKKPRPSKRKKSKYHENRKGKSGTHVKFLDSHESSKPPTKGLLVGARANSKPSPMKDIMAKANEMKKQMRDTYGYKE